MEKVETEIKKNMKILVCENYEEISQKAYELLSSLVETNPDAVLGLATGSTPEGLYEKMIGGFRSGEISYSNITSFNLDEYVGLDSNHPQSYKTFMREKLFNHIDMKESFLPFGKTKKDCEIYEKKIRNAGGIDLQILGIGGNGHIAFNEPGTAFDSVTHIVDLHERTIQDNARFFGGDIKQVPRQAITMGLSTIMDAKKIVLIASGQGKADAIKAMIEGSVTEQVPASILQGHPDVTVILDSEAANALEKSGY